MKYLVVTEKSLPLAQERDGGASLIHSLEAILPVGDTHWLQFSREPSTTPSPPRRTELIYPVRDANRFQRRIRNRDFVGKVLQAFAPKVETVIFVHASMQFCLADWQAIPFRVISFPMFLTPAYQLSREVVPLEYTRLERAALHQADLIISPSSLEQQQLVDTYGVPSDRIRVLPRSIDPSFFQPRPLPVAEPLRFAFVGSIKPQKGILELIHLFAQLRGTFPNSQLALIGAVQDQAYFQSVQQLIHQYGLETSIHLHGAQSPADLAQLLSDVHFHISCSRCETFGRTIFETLAMGIPNVIVGKHHAAQEYLPDKPYVRFVDSESAALLAVQQSLEHYASLAHMATEIGTMFSPDSLHPQLRDLLLSSNSSLAP